MVNIIGKKIKRLHAGRSVREVAKAASISQEYWHNIETGRRSPRDTQLYLKILCLGLGVPKAEAIQIIRDAALEEMGLRDSELRAICVAQISGRLPDEVRRGLVATYLGYRVLSDRETAGNGQK